jgi:hypothetical protein
MIFSNLKFTVCIVPDTAAPALTGDSKSAGILSASQFNTWVLSTFPGF